MTIARFLNHRRYREPKKGENILKVYKEIQQPWLLISFNLAYIKYKWSDAEHFVKWFKLWDMDFIIHAYSSILVCLLIENDI